VKQTLPALLSLAALVCGLGAAGAADARPHRHHHHPGYERRRHDNDAGAAVAAGIVGLALGAALTSGSNRDRYYDRGYYVREGYGPRYHEPRRVYRQTCRTTRYWDGYGYIDRTRCW
jgi:hypothetical protein